MFGFRPVLAGLLAATASLVVLSFPAWLEPAAGASPGALITDELLFEDDGVRIHAGPVPSWVDRFELPPPADVATPLQNGLRLVAVDEFASAMADPPVHYAHQVVDVVTAAGVQPASLFAVQINPAYDELVLHSVLTGPEGAARERVQDVVISVMDSEDLNALPAFTGRVNVVVRIPGVRPGDRVEVRYSVAGQPALIDHGRSVVFETPVAELARLRVRARAPLDAGQSAFGAYADPGRDSARGVETTVYHDGPYRPSTVDPLIPAWHFPQTSAVLSTTPGWADIAEWAAPFYRPVASEDVLAVAGAIAAEHSATDAQIAAALRYVQREIRYFALLLGDGGYQPLHPDETLRLMEGDCKAKALLLISLLDALGIESDAVLVNPMIGRGLDRLPPTAYAFNHVIVTLEHDGRRYWFDPTAFEQSGRLETLAQPDYGKALIAGPARTLIDMAVEYEAPLMAIDETYTLSGTQAGDRAEAALVLTFRDVWADNARYAVANLGQDAFIASMEQGFAGKFTAYEALSEPRVTDDREANTYSIAFDWSVLPINMTGRKSGLAQPLFAQVETLPPVPRVAAERDESLAAAYPHSVEHTLRIALPAGHESWIAVSPLDEARENAAFRYSVVRAQTGDVVNSRARLEMLSAEVHPSALERVNRDLAFVQAALPIVLGVRTPAPATAQIQMAMHMRSEPWDQAFGDGLALRMP